MASVTELEKDVAETRERLGATIDRIQDKLTVSGMVDEFMGQAGLPAAQDLVMSLLRRHPVPVMVAAAGIGFLIYRMNLRGGTRPAASLFDEDVISVEPVAATRIYDPDHDTRHPVSGSAASGQAGNVTHSGAMR